MNSRPPSATHWSTAWAGAAGFITASIAYKAEAARNSVEVALILILASIIPMALMELWWHRTQRSESAGFKPTYDFNFSRVLLKLVGFGATIGVLSAAYALFPVYRSNNYFPGFLKLVDEVWPFFTVGALIYFPWADARLKEPKDGYWTAGLFFLGQWHAVDWKVLRNYARGWLVKGFFTPLMTGFLVNSVSGFGSRSPSAGVDFNFTQFYMFFYDYLFLMDLAFGAIGYVFTFRILDSQIRTAEPTLLGWAAAVLCYTPFQENLTDKYLHYEEGFYWGNWLTHETSSYMLWGSLILILIGIYVWATFSFGFRFSNLTNRGIITTGPYRWSKHPAYLAKNLSWWFISIPFISNSGFWPALANCLLLLAVNFIYYLRARTEERHLSHDPAYVAYAKWMDEHALLAFLGKHIPALSYGKSRWIRPPEI